METLGDRVRRLRTQRGMSLAKVAGGDFSRAFLNQVELGKSRPSVRVLRVIANRLGAPVEYLLDGATPTLDREIALERARIQLLRGRFKACLAELEPAFDAHEWPLGVDARMTAAQALRGLGREAQALRLLEEQRAAISARADKPRLRKLRDLLKAKPVRAIPADAYLRQADRWLAAGEGAAALENYRAARTLLEARAPAGT